MILDIDIRISNDNGVQIQQFSKHFDSRFEGISGIGTTNNSISRGFEEFLAEFLTSSGRVIRNNLITEPTVFSDAKNKQYPGDVEYTLKLGDSGSVSGHIPLNKLFRLNELSKITDYSGTSNNTKSISSPPFEVSQKQAKSAGYEKEPCSPVKDDSLVLKRNNFKSSITLSEVDEMFCQFITTAVERYEDSFYVEDIINSNFAESS